MNDFDLLHLPTVSHLGIKIAFAETEIIMAATATVFVERTEPFLSPALHCFNKTRKILRKCLVSSESRKSRIPSGNKLRILPVTKTTVFND
ncbi:hypothetical protein NECAME_17565 [Necator americanus]|uniref:Uncharacterized protein n=1 Tax=Necator americanus TaxID=51031 RepID=W2TPR7_NECAM|nr:hypothetical protein NECAME_17565 [Necator americanus]ETN83131.1 hypothetical protein NECAME_17565 [Necator americanus]